MIVISGALVLVALVLLVIGLINPDLTFVYASIGASLAAGVFLLVGVLQRRGDDSSEDSGASADTDAGAPPGGDSLTGEGVTTLAVPVRPVAVAGSGATEGNASGGQVLVVAGRPRYHVEGCRYLTGKSAEAVNADDAREEGFTACGVCKPDEALAAQATVEPTAVDEAPAADDIAQEDAGTETEAAAPVKGTRTPAVRKAPAKTAKAPVKAPVKAPAKAATKTAAKAPAKTAAKAAAKPATSAASKAAATPVKRGSVLVIPDRGRFHTGDCRYVRGAEGTVELTKAAATKQGYAPCGVCNP